LASSIKNRPSGHPNITYKLRTERPEIRGKALHRNQLDAIATLLSLSEEASK